MQIHELPTSGVSDTDKFAFDTGTNTYAVTWLNIVNSIIGRTYSALTTTAKTITGAINELKTKVDALTYSANANLSSSAALGFTNVTLRRRGKLVQIYFGGGPLSVPYSDSSPWSTIVTVPAAYRPSADAPYAEGTPQADTSQPFLLTVRSNGQFQINPRTRSGVTSYVNSTFWYFID